MNQNIKQLLNQVSNTSTEIRRWFILACVIKIQKGIMAVKSVNEKSFKK